MFRVIRLLALGYLAYRHGIGGLQTLRAGFDGELHLLAFHEVAEPICLDGRKVHEHIFSAFTGDKAITLASVEPLDCADDSFRHFF